MKQEWPSMPRSAPATSHAARLAFQPVEARLNFGQHCFAWYNVARINLRIAAVEGSNQVGEG